MIQTKIVFENYYDRFETSVNDALKEIQSTHQKIVDIKYVVQVDAIKKQLFHSAMIMYEAKGIPDLRKVPLKGI